MRTTVDLDPCLLERLRDEAHRRVVPFKDLPNLEEDEVAREVMLRK